MSPDYFVTDVSGRSIRLFSYS